MRDFRNYKIGWKEYLVLYFIKKKYDFVMVGLFGTLYNCMNIFIKTSALCYD